MGAWLTKRRLRSLDPERVDKFSLGGKPRWVKVCKVYDGDTVTALIFIRGRPYKFQIRMMGYDSPEMKPPLDNANRQEEMAAAKAAKETLERLVGNGIVRLECPSNGSDKYGRVLGVLFDEKGRNLNQLMIDHGWGIPYQGNKKAAFSVKSWNPTPIDGVKKV
jgi:endonuclease YncB( thermonuclease family)